jgi:hypothetical protein
LTMTARIAHRSRSVVDGQEWCKCNHRRPRRGPKRATVRAMRIATTEPPEDRLDDRRKGPPLGPMGPSVHERRRAELWAAYVRSMRGPA